MLAAPYNFSLPKSPLEKGEVVAEKIATWLEQETTVRLPAIGGAI
jgi:hypothetical protein